MKLKFNKKSIKVLTPSNTSLPVQMTPQIGGGGTLTARTVDVTCNSNVNMSCWTFRNGQAHCELWEPEL
ncbi:hypothetical protein ACSLBF_05375 [Pseudoalteromonas sp. T1lg65]|uniref:hypothetical protein n=1 Tax=Pseudoalteromonas sp. T1lg65 TaxID=2077101 RepID=UPI003F7A685E